MAPLLLSASFVNAAAFSGTLDLIDAATGVVSLLIPLAASVALLYFFWGMAKFILNAGSEEGREEGKHIMVWGIIALFCIIAVWGLVSFVGEALGIRFIQFIEWSY